MLSATTLQYSNAKLQRDINLLFLQGIVVILTHTLSYSVKIPGGNGSKNL